MGVRVPLSAPVSYTHLDVYKRQALHFGREIGVGFGPAGLVDPEKPVLPLQLLEISSQYLLAAKTYGQEDIQKYLLYMVHYFRENPDRKTNDELQITIGNVQMCIRDSRKYFLNYWISISR